MPQARQKIPRERSRYEKGVIAVLSMGMRRLLMVDDEATEDEPRSVRMVMTPPVKVINLTDMTLEELEMFEKYVALGINRARPICAALDKEADEARVAGNVSFQRLFRVKPVYTELGASHAADG